MSQGLPGYACDCASIPLSFARLSYASLPARQFRTVVVRKSSTASEAFISVSLTASAHHRPALPLFKRQRICTVGRPTREHSQRIRTALREPSTPLPLPPSLGSAPCASLTLGPVSHFSASFLDPIVVAVESVVAEFVHCNMYSTYQTQGCTLGKLPAHSKTKHQRPRVDGETSAQTD